MSLCLVSGSAQPAPANVAGAALSRFNHVKCAPAPSLAPFIDHYWLTRWDRRGLPPRAAASLLDPCIHLQVQEGRAQVMGLVRGIFRMRIEGVGCVIGAQFRPGGFYPFVHRSVAAWTDRVVPAEEVFDQAIGPRRSVGPRALRTQPPHAAATRMHTRRSSPRISTRSSARGCRRGMQAPSTSRTWCAIIAANADIRRVSDLVRASGRSERTLDRLFGRYVGASPAWVVRRYRLHAAARATDGPPSR